MSAAANPSPSAAVKPSLTIKRRLNAPPEAVYAAWTDPKKLVHWFGPDQGPVTKAETDVRVGGRFHVVFHSEDGEEHDVSGIYREVVANEKLQFTRVLDRPAGSLHVTGGRMFWAWGKEIFETPLSEL